MKRILTLLMITFALHAKSQSPSPALIKLITFDGLENKIKPGYGSKANPIPSGAFKNPANANNMLTKMLQLTSSYRWPDGQTIDFSKRFSTAGIDGQSVIDCYILVQPGKTDTVKLFVDPYKDAPNYFVPEGLIMVTPQILAKELVPYVKQAEEIEASSDAFILKEPVIQLLTYINKKIGMGAFTDSDMLKEMIADKEADKVLSGFLFRAYIFNKFIAYAKNIPDEKTYAFNKMKQNFQEFIIAHPDIKTGNLSVILK